jgi:hypothetical protein
MGAGQQSNVATSTSLPLSCSRLAPVAKMQHTQDLEGQREEEVAADAHTANCSMLSGLSLVLAEMRSVQYVRVCFGSVWRSTISTL